jgi:hypothetical protein
MALLEDNTQVFMVRIWLETREIEDAPLAWRGVIEHVPSRQRRYFSELSEVTKFVGSFLGKLANRSDRGGG